MITIAFILPVHVRGAIVERLEWLGWCRKSPEGLEFDAGRRHPTTGKLCQPSSKWIPFSNQGRTRQRKERDGLRLFDLLYPRYSRTLTPTAPTLLRYVKYLPITCILMPRTPKIENNYGDSNRDVRFSSSN